MKERTVSYLRVSTRDLGQDTENQRRILEEFAKSKGWTYYEYSDTDSGGKSISDRPGLAKLFADARAGRIRRVVFWSLDRFSRQGTYETLRDLRELSSLGVEWISYSEQYLDTCGPFREAVIGIIGAIAAFERQRMSERVKAGIARARAEGKRGPGRPEIVIDDEVFRAAVQAGIGATALQSLFGVCRVTLRKHLARLGLTVRAVRTVRNPRPGAPPEGRPVSASAPSTAEPCVFS